MLVKKNRVNFREKFWQKIQSLLQGKYMFHIAKNLKLQNFGVKLKKDKICTLNLIMVLNFYREKLNCIRKENKKQTYLTSEQTNSVIAHFLIVY